MSDQETKLDAAEYVIGTLSGAERVAFESLMTGSAETRADVRYWENVFGSLNASISPEAPSASVWINIEAGLGGSTTGITAPSSTPEESGEANAAAEPLSASAPANDNSILALKRSRGRWRRWLDD